MITKRQLIRTIIARLHTGKMTSTAPYSMVPTTEASERNKAPITSVLTPIVNKLHKHSDHVNIVEVAAGTGNHGVHWAAQWPFARLLLTDGADENVAAIKTRVAQSNVSNIVGIEKVDTTDSSWR